MAGTNKVLAGFQKLGKALMLPIASMPAAALMLRLGAADVWSFAGGTLGEQGLPWVSAAGGAIIDNMAMLFAIGIAVGLAKENNGAAGLAGAIGFYVINNVGTSAARQFSGLAADASLNMGVLAGIVAGIVGGVLYNKFHNIRLPQVLGFFGGKRFVPIITSVVCMLIGLLAGFTWLSIEGVIDGFGNSVVGMGATGAFIFGVVNRLLIPIGLHHVMNTIFWFEFGNFTKPDGTVVTGDINRFLSGDPTAGMFQVGWFPIMMFGLPAACLAMIAASKPSKRKAISGALISIAVTSFLTGITEPIEYSFMFLAPALYVVHALLAGISAFITVSLGIRHGFGFSAGLIDYLLNFGLADKPLILALIGLAFAAVYFVIFYFAIKKFNLPTPGNEEDDDDNEEATVAPAKEGSMSDKARGYIEALGGKENLNELDACVTRLRLTVIDESKIDQKAIKSLGASGVMRLGTNTYQVVVGTVADILVDSMKQEMKK